MEHRDIIILRKILSQFEVAERKIAIYSLEEFQNDEVLKLAAAMLIINVGELVKTLSFSCRKAYPNIPWKAIAGFRDIAAHRYQTLRMDDVYETITVDFPGLCADIKKILEIET